jgi:RNA polymerase sigma-70 factor, ECF subfamily
MCHFALEPESVRRLILAAKAGDLTSFEQIVVLYERLVLRLAQRLLPNREMAQDAAQEVFLHLRGKLGKDLALWLYRITVNITICGGVRSPVWPLELAPILCDQPPDPEQAMLFAQQRELIAAALDELTERERAATVLRDLEGLSTAEVARISRKVMSCW